MITFTKDHKTNDGYIITTEDNEGYHKSINLTWAEVRDLCVLINKENKQRLKRRMEERYD